MMYLTEKNLVREDLPRLEFWSSLLWAPQRELTIHSQQYFKQTQVTLEGGLIEKRG